MIAELVKILGGMNDRLERMEAIIETLSIRIDRAASVIDTPTGHIILNGVAKTTTDEIAQAFRGVQSCHLESVKVDMMFSSAVFMALAPDAKEKMAKMFNENQIAHIKSLLDMHKQMEKMVGDVEKRIKFLDSIIEKANSKLTCDIEGEIAKRTGTEVNKMQALREVFNSKMMSMEKALAITDLALEKAKSAEARSKNRYEAYERAPHTVLAGKAD